MTTQDKARPRIHLFFGRTITAPWGWDLDILWRRDPNPDRGAIPYKSGLCFGLRRKRTAITIPVVRFWRFNVK